MCAGRAGSVVEWVSSLYRLLDGKDQVGLETPAVHLSKGPSCGQGNRGTCRSEGLLLDEHVPDGFGELAGDLDAGDLGAALLAETGFGSLVVVAVGGVLAAWVAASMSAHRRYLGPFLAREPRRSRFPDWSTRGHRPV